MPLDKNDKKYLNEQFEHHAKSTIDAIDSSIGDAKTEIITEVSNKILDRIDRLENIYALEKRVSAIEKKLAIKLKS